MMYGEFGEQVDNLALGLLSLGIKPGEKVALVLSSCNTIPVAMCAVIQMGFNSWGESYLVDGYEIKYILNDSDERKPAGSH